MSAQDWQCSVCTNRVATSFCYCNWQETFLCEQCIASHYQKIPFQIHIPAPIAAYGQHKIPGYYERLQSRYNNYPKRRDELQNNIRKIDKCITEVEEAIKTIIDIVQDYKESIIQGLKSEKEKLERGINEAMSEFERTMHEDAPILHSHMAKELRDCQDLKNLQYFRYKVDQWKTIYGLNHICDYSSFSSQFVIPGIYQSNLRLYDVKKPANQNFTLSVSFTEGLRLCFLNDESIFVVGSTPATRNAYIIQLPSGNLTETMVMQTARRLPGVIAVEEFAYVFGGDCIQCEKLKIPTVEWSQLPNLLKVSTARSPVLKDNKIYLIDAKSPIEVFDITSQALEQIDVNLDGFMGKWKYGDNFIRLFPFEQKGAEKLSQCLPLHTGRGASFSSSSGTLHYIDLGSKVCFRKYRDS